MNRKILLNGWGGKIRIAFVAMAEGESGVEKHSSSGNTIVELQLERNRKHRMNGWGGRIRTRFLNFNSSEG